MKYLLAFILITLSAQVYAQQDSTNIIQPPSSIDTEDDVIYEFTEVRPMFAGGHDKYDDFIKNNLNYPKALKKNKIQGTTYVDIIINKDGSISNAKVRRDIGGGSAEEAIRLINSMPKWIPAMQNGRAVAFKMTIPIRFRLD
ncbi:MAG: energy transducer TonB [Bacteroidia bacterium]